MNHYFYISAGLAFVAAGAVLIAFGLEAKSGRNLITGKQMVANTDDVALVRDAAKELVPIAVPFTVDGGDYDIGGANAPLLSEKAAIAFAAGLPDHTRKRIRNIYFAERDSPAPHTLRRYTQGSAKDEWIVEEWDARAKTWIYKGKPSFQTEDGVPFGGGVH